VKKNNKDHDLFSKNYQILQEISDKLSSQNEPDIDNLVPMIEEATRAYQICKKRLDKVKLALADHLERAPFEKQQS